MKAYAGQMNRDFREGSRAFNKSFSQLQAYLETLEHLAIASDWIRETMRDIRRLSRVKSGLDVYSPAAQEILTQNWNIIRSTVENHEFNLQARIKTKTEEVKSLRDGVCPPSLLGSIHH